MLPDLPIVADFIPGFGAASGRRWRAEKYAGEIIGKLNKNQHGACRSCAEGAVCRLVGTVFPTSPVEFGSLSRETEKWGKVVRFAGIKAE
jgi:hypothetical protein